VGSLDCFHNGGEVLTHLSNRQNSDQRIPIATPHSTNIRLYSTHYQTKESSSHSKIRYGHPRFYPGQQPRVFSSCQFSFYQQGKTRVIFPVLIFLLPSRPRANFPFTIKENLVFFPVLIFLLPSRKNPRYFPVLIFLLPSRPMLIFHLP
jgi:hypothetical protein